MPCYFVSSGIEIPMTNQTFDFIWNGFGNKELTDSETSSSSEEGDKTGSLVEKARNAEWRKYLGPFPSRASLRYFPKRAAFSAPLAGGSSELSPGAERASVIASGVLSADTLLLGASFPWLDLLLEGRGLSSLELWALHNLSPPLVIFTSRSHPSTTQVCLAACPS